jgi:hypothetical protein
LLVSEAAGEELHGGVDSVVTVGVGHPVGAAAIPAVVSGHDEWSDVTTMRRQIELWSERTLASFGACIGAVGR